MLASLATTEVGRQVNTQDVVVIRSKFDFGCGKHNPFDHVYFFEGNDFSSAYLASLKSVRMLHPLHAVLFLASRQSCIFDVLRQVSLCTPQSFFEESLALYYKVVGDQAVVQALCYAFEQWCQVHGVFLFEQVFCPSYSLHYGYYIGSNGYYEFSSGNRGWWRAMGRRCK